VSQAPGGAVNGPLTGVRVLEIGHMLAGPYCGMLLADLGADVVKIEPPAGDIARTVSPHWIGPHNAYFASLNRSKRSLTLDLATPAGQHALHGLVATAHALVTNLRPSAIRKLGLTYAYLGRWNPRIVCVALTGYGLDSPYADRPAYDYVIQALTGVMALGGEPGGPPAKTGYSAVDNSAGMMGALGLLAKIVEGRGGQLDIAMYDVMLSQLNYLAGAWLNAGERAERLPQSAHPYIVPAQLFATRDGWLALFITHDDFWGRFCREVGRPGWLADERFATMAARRRHRDVVLAALGELLAADTTARWVGRLAPLGLVVAGVETLEQALASEHVAHRRMVVTIDTPAGRLRVVGNPIKILDAETRYAPPPLLGEHNGATGERRPVASGRRGEPAR
jgi:CoA:oxalate CoA-transferase